MLKNNFKIPKVLQNPLFIKLLWEIQGVTINTIDVPKNAQFSCWKQLKSWKSLVDLLLNNCNTLILRLKLRNNFFKNIAFTFASDAAMLIGWKHLAMLDVITQYTLPAMFLQNHCRLRQAKHADALHSPLSVRPDSEGTCNKLTTPV